MGTWGYLAKQVATEAGQLVRRDEETGVSRSFAPLGHATMEPNWMALPSQLIADSLCLYPLHHQHVRHLEYFDGMVRGIVEPHQIDYSTIVVRYYTAQQIVEISSQMAYLLAAATMVLGKVTSLPSSVYPLFIERMREGNIYYTKLDIHFRRKVSNAIVQPVTISLGRTGRYAGLQIIRSQMTFGKGSTNMEAQLVLPLRK